MENISRNLPNICTFSFVRHSKYKRPRGARSSCAYDGWRSQKSEMRMYTWRNSRWRRKSKRTTKNVVFKPPLSTTGCPRLGCVLLTSNAITRLEKTLKWVIVSSHIAYYVSETLEPYLLYFIDKTNERKLWNVISWVFISPECRSFECGNKIQSFKEVAQISLRLS